MTEKLTLRQATESDNPAVFRLFMRSVRDLEYRQGVIAVNDGDDPLFVAEQWEKERPMFEHLARTAHSYWLAERDGEVVGYARSILRERMLELTEFFVSPGEQSQGVGRELLKRVFAAPEADVRTIIASTDTRAQARYLKTGVYPKFPIFYFYKRPEPSEVVTDLSFVPMESSDESLESLAELDREILGYRRGIDHAWFMSSRTGFLYVREGRPAGYGYITRGGGSGPFAVQDAADFPAVLAHAESVAAGEKREQFGLQIPMINRVAVDYLLQRGFLIESDVILFMSNGDHSGLDHYIITSPPFFM